MSILGLDFKRSRYGGVTLMCDQDTDGSHMNGLGTASDLDVTGLEESRTQTTQAHHMVKGK